MRRLILPFALIAGLVILFFAFRPALETLFETVFATIAGTEPDAPPDPETAAALEAALAEAVARNRETALAFVVFDVRLDLLRVSADGTWALLWIAAVDRETREVAAMEPWIAIGRLLSGGAWTVTFPGEPAFPDLLAGIPESIFPPDERLILGQGGGEDCDTSAIGPFTGYRLPWEAGKTFFLTQSIYHTLGWGVNPTFSMLHAFDFSSSPSGLFDISAARPGTVKYVWEGQANNDPTSPGNYIVLEDTGTTPKSYQLYLHLAQGSIPPALKNIGAPVQRGQVVGVADDTGFSTGHHLHFQVHTEVSWWGCSVDVRFEDVPINGGRPRLPIEAENFPEYGAQGQTTYVSGNTPPPTEAFKPGGGLLDLPHGQLVGAGGIALDGYAFDYQTGIATASFAVRADGEWTPVGQTHSFTPVPGTVFFSGDVDLCSAGVPDGPVVLGVIAADGDGNVLEGGLAVPAVLDADCLPPPPACVPAADQVAVFQLPDYRGACIVFGPGTHFQNSQIHSILVGDDVSATLFKTTGLTGRARSLWADNANLSEDWSGAENYAAVLVKLRSTLANVPKPAWPSGGAVLPLEGALNLVWDDGGGGAEFQVQLDGPAGQATSDWIGLTYWNPGDLVAGDFSWQVRARSGAGTTGWSAAASFAITPTITIPSSESLTAPVTANFDTGTDGWYSTGLWNLLQDPAAAFNGLFSFWYGQPPGNFTEANYGTVDPNTGSLTSPPIFIPGPGFNLRFYANTDTEADRTRWDRRGVFVSAEGGPFVEVFVQTEDTQGVWIRSPFIDLSPYAGQSIRVRFIFDSLDARRNGFTGWRIDEVTILTTPPPSCPGTLEPDDHPADATALAYDIPIDSEICPIGDTDYFAFSGSAGDRILVDIDARTNGSELDAAVFLFAEDGTSLLANADDEVPGVLLDPLLPFTLPRTGTYFIQVRRTMHPGVATADHTYRLTVVTDADDPVVTDFTASVPLNDPSGLPPTVVLSVDAVDGGLGVAAVEFLYHSSDWGQAGWVSLGVDTDGTDGWSAVWDTQALSALPGIALVARAVDPVGNTATIGMWNLFPLPPALFLPVVISE